MAAPLSILGLLFPHGFTVDYELVNDQPAEAPFSLKDQVATLQDQVAKLQEQLQHLRVRNAAAHTVTHRLICIWPPECWQPRPAVLRSCASRLQSWQRRSQLRQAELDS